MSAVHQPSAALAVLRIVILTVLFTALGFALGLFFGIVGIVLANMIRGGSISMTHAYRTIALPVAIAVGITALVVTTISEIREYRRERNKVKDYLRVA